MRTAWKWSIKQGPEAKVEVVMSRVLPAVGYHQPPVYGLPRWIISGAPSSGVQTEARFRPKHTVLKDAGEWSWQENPFIGTRPLSRLSSEQWRDAFRAGGYDEATSERFIARIRAKVVEGQALDRQVSSRAQTNHTAGLYHR